jgi:PPOX class probable F420-dependent enzyme
MPRKIATTTTADRAGLVEFLRDRQHAIVLTTRVDGAVQASPVSAGIDSQGRVVVATYPQRAKVTNARRHPAGAVLFLSDDWNGPWVQVVGRFEVIDLPDAVEPLVDYFRAISGEHPDWDEYRQAMVDQASACCGSPSTPGDRSPPAASPPTSLT